MKQMKQFPCDNCGRFFTSDLHKSECMRCRGERAKNPKIIHHLNGDAKDNNSANIRILDPSEYKNYNRKKDWVINPLIKWLRN